MRRGGEEGERRREDEGREGEKMREKEGANGGLGEGEVGEEGVQVGHSVVQ